MTFLNDGDNSYILNRFATDINYLCRGVASKLFSFFIKKYHPSKIKSFADKRWAIRDKKNVYDILGFNLIEELEPNYRYVNKANPTERIHKFNFRKEILHKKYGLPLSMTENEMAKELGYERIWDCGLLKYIFTP